jgi:hypothetical protein
MTIAIAYISLFSIILPITAGALKFRNITGIFRYFYFFLIFTAVFDLFNAFLASHGIRNDWIVHLFFPVELFFISEVIRNWLKKRSSEKAIFFSVRILIIIWFTYSLYLLIHLQISESFFVFREIYGEAKAVSYAVLAIALISFSFMLLKDFTAQTLPVPFFRSKKFWFAMAVIIYFMGTGFFQSLLYNIISNDLNTARKLWVFQSGSYFLRNILFAAAFLCRK